MGAAAGAFLIAAASLLHKKLGITRRISGKWTGVHLLQVLHSGHIGDYVTWIIVGIVVFSAVFASMAFHVP